MVKVASILTCILMLSSVVPFGCAQPTAEPDIEGGLLILSHSTYVDEYGYFHLVGEVLNTGEGSCEQSTVFASFFDDDGVVYATGAGPCYRRVIAPNEKAPFEIVLSGAPQGNGYVLTIECEATDMAPEEGVTFRDVMPSVDADSRYVVTGEIVNEGPDSIDSALIICTYYDAAGKVVAVGLSFAEASPIEPGGSSSFTLVLDPSVSSDIDHIALHSEVRQ